MSVTSMKMIGVSFFNDALRRDGAPADFAVSVDGTLRMSAANGPVTLESGGQTEWSVRIFCYVENLPAVAVQDSYLGYLSGRTW